jgi:prevent-host-death family protein
VDTLFILVYTSIEVFVDQRRKRAMEISVKEARSRFRSILDQVQEGDEVIIRRRGKEIARLVPPRGEGKRLPALKSFRAGIRIKGESLSAVVKRGRTEERY